MLSVGEKQAVICAEAITDSCQRQKVLKSLRNSKKEVIEISFYQMRQFCANILEVQNIENEKCLIMSEAANKAFTKSQKDILENQSKIVSSPLQTIEYIGGGSARCMIAEIF